MRRRRPRAPAARDRARHSAAGPRSRRRRSHHAAGRTSAGLDRGRGRKRRPAARPLLRRRYTAGAPVDGAAHEAGQRLPRASARFPIRSSGATACPSPLPPPCGTRASGGPGWQLFGAQRSPWPPSPCPNTMAASPLIHHPRAQQGRRSPPPASRCRFPPDCSGPAAKNMSEPEIPVVTCLGRRTRASSPPAALLWPGPSVPTGAAPGWRPLHRAEWLLPGRRGRGSRWALRRHLSRSLPPF